MFFKRQDIVGKGILTCALVLAAALASPGAVQAARFKVLYSFCGETNCTDGERPYTGPLVDAGGNIYGTTQEGGANNRGSVFKLSPDGKETVLYSFCPASGCTDGAYPEANLIMDAKGNLFGTTVYGGADAEGTVFEILTGGTEQVLYSFCAMPSCSDGQGPYAGLIADAKGNLYGTTQSGGTQDSGIVFKLSSSGKETVLYSFCKERNCKDGLYPQAGLIMDKAGNLYGTTTQGGGHHSQNCREGCGTVFELTPKGKETILYSFCAQKKCIDGYTPAAPLIMDADGDLYGTTEYGGGKKEGTVFELAADGSETVLYSFCMLHDCRDGANPESALLMDASGVLYGVTGAGSVRGVAFSLTPSGTETILHGFCSKTGCADGNEPSGLTMDGKGNLYGTTYAGGAADLGTVFRVIP